MRFLVLLLALMAAPSAFGWGKMGHLMVGAIAYEQLTPEARAQADRLLTLNPSYAEWTGGTRQVKSEHIAERVFMLAADWPDALRSMASYTDEGDQQDAPDSGDDKGYADHRRHAYWHYVDVPFSTDGTAVKPGRSPNVLTQITAFSEVLADPAADETRKSYALVWLLHLVADIHQPLHDVTRFTHSEPDGDSGGSKVELSCPPHIRGAAGNPPAKHRWYCAHNLQAFWNGMAGDEYLGEEAWQGQSDLVPQALEHIKELPSADAERAQIGDPQVWLKEGVMLAQTLVYSGPIGGGAGPYAIDVNYHNKARLIAQQQLALAGARLARLLNQRLRSPPPAACGVACAGGSQGTGSRIKSLVEPGT